MIDQDAEATMPSPTPGFTDFFTDDRRRGKVIGTETAEGILRRGVDVERVISIDNGALRIQPLIEPGWGRATIAYGPYRRRNGLAFAVFMVNGHNTAQSENLRETLGERLERWRLGSETYTPKERIFQWLFSKQKRRIIRQMKWWMRINQRAAPVPRVDENLAVGWFPNQALDNPLAEGNAFVMHATGPENGELWARVSAHQLPAIRGVQNLQIYYVIILREGGAAYYACSVPSANGLSAYPQLRPIAIDPFHSDAMVYAGISQSTLGQIGFRLDTRVYATRVVQLSQFATWYGTAHAADQLTGSRALTNVEAKTGGRWKIYSGACERTAHGASPCAEEALAVLDPGAPSGLVHLILEASPGGVASASVVWRFLDPDNFWCLRISKSQCELSVKEKGSWETVASSNQWHLDAGPTSSVQVLDNGQSFSLFLQGRLLFESRFTDRRLQNATGVGFQLVRNEGQAYVRSFEAHPRTVPLPEELNLGEPWLCRGHKTVIADDFRGVARDLAGKTTSFGGKVWKKEIGKGIIELTGYDSAKICANAQQPNPGRTVYTIDWDYPELADLEVNITPPGSERGQREHGTSGFAYWQDSDNYITINIWVSDSYNGASISTFFHLNGFEDLYDAIWTNVGRRVYWGVPLMFRTVFDGMRYIAFVDEEPVLYRALTDVYPNSKQFLINRVGLIANWEWGNDTGSVFRNFVGRI